MGKGTHREEFLSLVGRRRSNECWPWLGTKRSKLGYGAFYANGRLHSAHRIAYAIAYGPIALGAVIRHACDNPTCVNPSHLMSGTQKENIHDMLDRERFTPPRGEKNGQVKLTDTKVREIRERYGTDKPKRGPRPSGTVRMQDLANEYGVSLTLIHMIIKRARWAWLDEFPPVDNAPEKDGGFIR